MQWQYSALNDEEAQGAPPPRTHPSSVKEEQAWLQAQREDLSRLRMLLHKREDDQVQERIKRLAHERQEVAGAPQKSWTSCCSLLLQLLLAAAAMLIMVYIFVFNVASQLVQTCGPASPSWLHTGRDACACVYPFERARRRLSASWTARNRAAAKFLTSGLAMGLPQVTSVDFSPRCTCTFTRIYTYT